VILYLDSSALIKLYIDEPGREEVKTAVRGAPVVATHVVAYAELRAALGRLNREGRLRDGPLERVKAAFEDDWKAMALVAAEEPIVRRAGELAEGLGLRGFDAVHLAAAESLAIHGRTGVLFACFDGRLARAAATLGFALL
jgi:predicted nucleic acid-binding protein